MSFDGEHLMTEEQEFTAVQYGLDCGYGEQLMSHGKWIPSWGGVGNQHWRKLEQGNHAPPPQGNMMAE